MSQRGPHDERTMKEAKERGRLEEAEEMGTERMFNVPRAEVRVSVELIYSFDFACVNHECG